MIPGMEKLMIFGLGPVVRYELITTARRGRFYLARVVYGLALLLLLWNEFRSFNTNHPGGGTIEQVQTFAEATFIQFAGAQGAAVLCLIPALIAGVIADEHQRKTLHYLLASRLSSAEIVLGKLGGRLVHVGTFIALGIPVVCLLALYGGLNPENVWELYLGTFTTVIFASGLSILVSIMARRPRDAILAAYSLEALWLLLPVFLVDFSRHLEDGPLWWVAPVNHCVLLINPAYVWEIATWKTYSFTRGGLRSAWFLGQFMSAFYWMVGLQALFGLSFVALAVMGLRPMRGNSWPGAQPQTGWWSRLAARISSVSNARVAASLTQNTLLLSSPDRPPCGDDPMLWKERHTSLGGGLRWLRSRPMLIFFSVLIGCYLLDVAYPLFVAAIKGGGHEGSRLAVTASLRSASVFLAFVGMLGVAASAAVSVTGEREQDTWISLATTLLMPAEIVRAKQVGAVLSVRRIALALLVMWAAGLGLLAIHPLGVLAAALYLVLIAWFVASLGVFASAFARNSTRALATTFIAILIFSAISQWPMTVWTLLFSYQDLAPLASQSPFATKSLLAALTWVSALSPIVAFPYLGAALMNFGSRQRLRTTWGQ
jgi:ABC-type transport system involved in multi-copper enzyme maturation permease subunit